MNEPSIKSVIDAHSPKLHAIEGVVSVAEGSDSGEPCILVFIERDDAAARRKIMEELAGYAVRIVVTGEATLSG